MLLGLVAPVFLMLVACESMNSTLPTTEFDPLSTPGSRMNSSSDDGSGLLPGQFVSAAINNTTFYTKRPKGTEDADKLLTQGTQMKIVSADTSFVKVELDSGDVGFVPTAMISTGESVLDQMIPVDGIYQVYPTLPDGGPVEPLPLFDPNGLPLEGSIPLIIDPDAPLDNTTPKLDSVPEIKRIEEEKKVEEKVEEQVEKKEEVKAD